VIFRATPQWFISMEQATLLRVTLRCATSRGEVDPDWGEQRITGMIENRPDWCISRQRTWGVPIALFVHRAERRAASAHGRADRAGGRASSRAASTPGSRSTRASCSVPSARYDKVTDVLDVWFDSGVTHECVLDARGPRSRRRPICTSRARTSTAAGSSSLLMSAAHPRRAPYKACSRTASPSTRRAARCRSRSAT
jgi:isoleucyl-tRNA synthetase